MCVMFELVVVSKQFGAATMFVMFQVRVVRKKLRT